MTMPNLHPQFVHFPIAGGIFFFLLLAVSFVFKKEGARTAALWILPLTALGALAAATTGLLFEEFFPHPHEGEAHALMDLHETLGLVTAGVFLLFSLLVWLFKKSSARIFPIALLIAAIGSASLVAFTGYLGGEFGHTHGLVVPEEKRASETTPSSETKEPGETQEPHGHSHDHEHHH